MTYGWSALWFFAPNLLLCIILLLVLRRQTASHKLAIAKLEALKRSLDALNDDGKPVDPSEQCRPQHDPLPKAETKVRSRLRSVDNLLRRR
ncbi:hypothetical protein [Sphingomonas sp. 10B4]|uniref:hypothetical protein n=1 Tax=Sphingomonas sp. 10B4 TaxID=3048575 RepID=UPI002AB3CB8A|nr:hypothetical protein [Sphingomonas sp. 10B4]MDY7524315.1 hypothetical protein [Sphingomonas sp. 10B4]MEB0282219.1 hypothetical protein [Sphingomonas sp. 10B4]